MICVHIEFGKFLDNHMCFVIERVDIMMK